MICQRSPNVFFELGIRTAVNKPIALVKDDISKNVPFDTNIINYYTYHHSLTPWALDTEVERLSEHLKNCFESADAENSLWKYFSLSSQTPSVEKPTSGDDRIDHLTMQVAALRKDIENRMQKPQFPDYEQNVNLIENAKKRIEKLSFVYGVEITSIAIFDKKIQINYKGDLPVEFRKELMELSVLTGIMIAHIRDFG